MTAMPCAEARLSLGAYVLGALDPSERLDVEQHLEGCPACRDELAELAGLPGLLAHVDVSDVIDGEPTAPPELLERLLAAASSERRSARRWRVMTAAAVVAITSAGTAAVAAQLAEGHPIAAVPAPSSVFSAVDPVSHVQARVSTQSKNWGTAVRVQLTGVQQGQTCSLVVVNKTGEHEVAATWKVNYTGAVDVQGATEYQAADIASYDVVTTQGQHLVSVPA